MITTLNEEMIVCMLIKNMLTLKCNFNLLHNFGVNCRNRIKIIFANVTPMDQYGIGGNEQSLSPFIFKI